MKKHLITLCFLLGLVGTRASAYNFEVDGIYYEITNSSDPYTVSVTYKNDNYNSYSGSVRIPSTVTYNGQVYTVTLIRGGAFQYCSGLSSVTISNNITQIGPSAFRGCSSLTSISIPNNVTYIDNHAFEDCTSLKEITFEDGNNKLSLGYQSAYFGAPQGEGQFYDCPLERVYLGRDLYYETGEKYGYSPFYQKTTLTSVIVGETVTSFKEMLFANCSKLSTITIKATTSPTLGSNVFSSVPKSCVLEYPQGCYENYASWAEYITVPLTDFSVDGFYYNVLSEEDMTVEVTFQGDTYSSYANEYAGDIVIPQTVTYADKTFTVTAIGESAFRDCTGITSLTIPANVTSIGNNALDGDYINLSKLTIEDATTPLTLGHCPNGERLGWGLFYACYLTEPIYIGRDLVYDSTHFGGYSPFNLYNGNTVPSVTFGKYVTEVGNNLFGGEVSAIWGSLKNIYFNSNPTIGTNALYAGATIHLNLSDEEATDFCADNANTYADVTYERNLPAGKYGTITLPFTPDAESTGNFVFYQLSSANERELMFDEVAQPQANTPYLYTLREGKSATQITGGQTTIASTINNPETVNNMQMIGSFTNQTIATGEDASYYYYAYTSADNKLHKILKELTVKPYRAYFKNPAMTIFEVSSYSVYLRGANGIQKISIDDIEDFDHMLYDMSGRPVSNPVKGNIYIKNGKKLIY